MIDSHSHLNDARLLTDIDGVLGRALAAGVVHVVTPGCDVPGSRTAVRLAETYPAVTACAGVHPHEASTLTSEVEAELRLLLGHPRVRAVGEIGLDFHYDHSPRTDQARAFALQLRLAADLCLPVVVHTREAFEPTMAALRPVARSLQAVVLHCWCGSLDEARAAVDAGYYLGFGGITTFPRADEIRQAAALCPPDRLLVETDAPYLAPAPFRGRTNEPAYLSHVVQSVAAARGVGIAEIGDLTASNARTVFGISR